MVGPAGDGLRLGLVAMLPLLLPVVLVLFLAVVLSYCARVGTAGMGTLHRTRHGVNGVGWRRWEVVVRTVWMV